MAVTREGGTVRLVLEALDAGHRTVPEIARYARVEALAAREALALLRTTGDVRRYGNTKYAWYRRVRRRGTCRG